MSEASVNESTEKAAEKPFLTVVNGNPTDEDLAVLVSVLAGAGAGGGEPEPEIRNDWGRPVDRLRPQWGAPSSFTNMRY